MYKAIRLKTIYIQIIIILALSLFVILNSFTSFATTPIKTDNFTFLDWCLHSTNSKASITVAQIFTVLSEEIAAKQDVSEPEQLTCQQADKLLRQKTSLDLDGGTYMGNAYNDIQDKTTLFITDLRPLQSLTNLREIDLSMQLIADLKPLRLLTNLTRLMLNSNKIVDIRSLASLKNLRYLNLQDNKITDIQPLGKLTKLTYLNVQYNPIKQKKCPFLRRVCHF